jgi:hypothetical protein
VNHNKYIALAIAFSVSLGLLLGAVAGVIVMAYHFIASLY